MLLLIIKSKFIRCRSLVRSSTNVFHLNIFISTFLVVTQYRNMMFYSFKLNGSGRGQFV